MEAPMHYMAQLFAQLGLPSDAAGIATFIAEHSPLPSDVPLAEAPFWTEGQAAFLLENMQSDADWTGVIDALNEELREVDHGHAGAERLDSGASQR